MHRPDHEVHRKVELRLVRCKDAVEGAVVQAVVHDHRARRPFPLCLGLVGRLRDEAHLTGLHDERALRLAQETELGDEGVEPLLLQRRDLGGVEHRFAAWVERVAVGAVGLDESLQLVAGSFDGHEGVGPPDADDDAVEVVEQRVAVHQVRALEHLQDEVGLAAGALRIDGVELETGQTHASVAVGREEQTATLVQGVEVDGLGAAGRLHDDGAALLLHLAEEAHAKNVDAGVGRRRHAGAGQLELGVHPRLGAVGEGLGEPQIPVEQVRDAQLRRRAAGHPREVVAEARHADPTLDARLLVGGVNQVELLVELLFERALGEPSEVQIDGADLDLALDEAVNAPAVANGDAELVGLGALHAHVDHDLIAVEAHDLHVETPVEQGSHARRKDEVVRQGVQRGGQDRGRRRRD